MAAGRPGQERAMTHTILCFVLGALMPLLGAMWLVLRF
jgi:hypothetical protein